MVAMAFSSVTPDQALLGRSASGLAIGVQLAAARGNDAMLLELAQTLLADQARSRSS